MAPHTPANIAVITGPVLFGDLINWGLFGVLTVQVYLYYQSFPKDKSLIKAVVYTTYAVEVIQTALATREAFRILAIGWGKPEVLVEVGWLGIIIPCLVSLLTWISQTFYAWRIYVLRRSLWIPIPVATLALLQLICGMISGIRIELIGVWSKVEAETHVTTTVRLSSALLCDAVIAASMLQFLYSSRQTIMPHTHTIVSKLIRLIFETGLILMVVASLDLAFFLAFPHNSFFFAPASTLSKLYSNAMLVMLNVRMEVVGGRSGTRMTDLERSGATMSFAIAPFKVVPSSSRETIDSD